MSSKKGSNPKSAKVPTKYPGLFIVPNEVVKEFPDGYTNCGKDYAKALVSQAKVMKRARNNPIFDALYNMRGWEWEWNNQGCSEDYVGGKGSPDKLDAIQWNINDQVVIRLREDGLLTFSPDACSVVSKTLYMRERLTNAVSEVGCSVWTMTRGMVFPDPVVPPDGLVRLKHDQLQTAVRWFKKEYPMRHKGSRGNNYYDFTRVVVKRHPSIPDQSAIMFVLDRVVYLGGGSELIGAYCEGAIVAEIRSDGTLAINNGWVDPVERLGTRGRDSGAGDSNDYGQGALWHLWEHVCSQLVVEQ